MPDPALHGNGRACHACELRRAELAGPLEAEPIPCQLCGGSGRLALEAEAILAATVAEARARYWPDVLARWRDAGAP